MNYNYGAHCLVQSFYHVYQTRNHEIEGRILNYEFIKTY